MHKRSYCASLDSSASDVGQHQDAPDMHQEAAAAAFLAWSDTVESITSWVCSVPKTPPPHSHCFDCPATKSHQPPAQDVMSERSPDRRERKLAVRRSCSPTKKSPQYRSTILKPNGIHVDEHPSLPAEIEALLPDGLRSILNGSSSIETDTASISTEAQVEVDSWKLRLAEHVAQMAESYRQECHEITKKSGNEPDYRAAIIMIINHFARLSAWRDVLCVQNSDRGWNTLLKPPTRSQTLPWPWPSLAEPNSSSTATWDALQSEPSNTQSSFNTTIPPPSTDPSEISTTSTNLEGTITTPKPDVVVGLAREAFSSQQNDLFAYWQAASTVLSAPYASEGDLRFPFLIIELKGLATESNLLGAQNQAAGAGACALRLLESLGAQDPYGQHDSADTPRIVFSVTTEGPAHELWVHYQLGGNEERYYMTCLGIWRPTIKRDSNEFVAVLARILRWGVDEFLPQVMRIADRRLRRGPKVAG